MKEPRWLTIAAIHTMHEELIAEHGGSSGVRDEGLLESALARAPNLFAYGQPSLTGMAASYAFGIARNHPFVDGNKRTALMAAYVFLGLNGQRLTAPEAEAVVMTQELASGACGEADYAAWLASHLEPVKTGRK
jgi:death on curing protein